MVALLKLYQLSLDCLQLENNGKKTKSLSGDSFSPSEQVFNLASLTRSLSFHQSFDRRLMRTIFFHIWFLFPSVAEESKWGWAFGWGQEDNGINDFICGEDDMLTSITFGRNSSSCSLWPFSPYIHLLIPSQEALYVPVVSYLCVSTFGYFSVTFQVSSPWVLCVIPN